MAIPLDERMAKAIMSLSFGPGDEEVKIAGRKLLIFGSPKIGKTVLAARLGKCNFFITDEDGYTSLLNASVKDKVGHWRAMPFNDWASVKQVLQAGEAGQLKCQTCGNPFDNYVLDTVSGIVAQVLQEIVQSGTTPTDGKISPEAAGRPDYLVSRERLYPVMRQIAQMRNASVTLLMHTREVGKVKPQILPDVHNAAYEVINKYVSVQAYLSIKDGQRMLQVRPNGNGIAAGSRYDFPDVFVSDDDFVAHIEQWKKAI